MKQSILIADFTAGEISHKLYGRIDGDVYYKGARTMVNCRPLSQGGWKCVGGSWFCTDLPNLSFRGIPMIISETVQFIVLLGTQEARAYQVDSDGNLGAAQVLSYGVTYSEEQLSEIQYCQNYNEIYITHQNHAPRVISYVAGSWAYSNLAITTNADEDIPFQSAGNFPGCCAFFAGRLWLAGTTSKPQGVWASVPFDPGNFTWYEEVSTTSPEMTDQETWEDSSVPEYEDVTTTEEVIGEDNAFHFEIASDQNDSIIGLSPREDMVIRTITSEYEVPNDVSAQSLEAKFKTRYGGTRLQAKMIDGNIILVQRGGKKIREYQDESNSQDLTFYSDHITGEGVTGYDFCRVPEKQIYFVRSDGTMAVCLYDTSEDIIAWYRLEHCNGKYESVICVSTEAGDYAYVVIASEDGTARWIERLDEDLIVQSAEPVSFSSGAGTTSSRLYGETVQIQEAGEAEAGGTGAVSFSDLDGLQTVGRGFTSTFETLSLSPGAEFGPGIMKERQIVELFMMIYQGKNFKVGTVSDSYEDLILIETYDEKAGIRGGFEVDAGIKIVRDQPFPLEISALMPEVEVNEK